MMKNLALLLILVMSPLALSTLTCVSSFTIQSNVNLIPSSRNSAIGMIKDRNTSFNDDIHRRHFFSFIITSSASIVSFPPRPTYAIESDIINTVEMKTFTDPKGLFSLAVPKRFFTIRRTAKGDLPDEETGKGRRGSSIFTAGDLNKSEIIGIERYPVRILLLEEGIAATGDLSSFNTIGDAKAIALLITNRREKDQPNQGRTSIIPDSITVSNDGKRLNFSLKTIVNVQKPELLLEQTGLSELVRITVAKATLDSNDGQMMVIFASSLQQDFNGVDGTALNDSVDSFQAFSSIH